MNQLFEEPLKAAGAITKNPTLLAEDGAEIP